MSTENPLPGPYFVEVATTRKAGPVVLLVRLFVGIGILVTLVALILPATRSAGPAARSSQCKNNLKQIALALHNYVDSYGALPPAYTVDAQGRPLHSWRTLILPYLDQAALFGTIDLSKPWDDPVNAKAYETEIATYRCPSATFEKRHTSYMAVVGSNACFQPTARRKLSEITDDHSQTWMVIEADPKLAVHWMSPLDADDTVLFNFGPKSKMSHAPGTHVLLVDGSIRVVPGEMSEAERRALISIAGNDANAIDFFSR
jgi:type II secretory pathway pseudopilin PulG